MNHYAIIADDFTGACDSGVHFAATGKKTALLLDSGGLSGVLAGHDAVAVSTESRFLPPGPAAEATRRAADACRDAGAEVFFKKIDSTLRGNLGAEIEAALAATGCVAAVVCPAMPKTGRTVREGRLYVNGEPVDKTGVGKDPFTPVTSSLIAEIVAKQTALPCRGLTLAEARSGANALRDLLVRLVKDGNRIIIPDALENGDLAAIGEMLRESQNDYPTPLPRLLPVGAGGLAEGFVGPAVPADEPKPRGRMLAVVGSLNRTSIDQIAHAVEHAAPGIIEIDMAAALADPDAAIRLALAEADRHGGRHLLLKNRTLPAAENVDTDSGVRAAAVFGAVAKAVCAGAGCARLYVTGGSTAVAVAAAFGIKSITLRKEFLPGVVISDCDCPDAPVRHFITKAGGFGTVDTLSRLFGA